MIFRNVKVKKLFNKTTDTYDQNTNDRKNKGLKKEPDFLNTPFGIDGNCGKGSIEKGNTIGIFINR